MVDWDPRENMGLLSYLRFKMGGWVEVDTVPEWVKEASNPPKKTRIPANGSVEAVFTGDSLEYKVITKRLPRGAGTYTEVEYRVRIKDKASPGSAIKLALALAAIVLVAGVLPSVAPSDINNLSNNETSVATSNDVNNPWNSKTVSVATSTDASKQLEVATKQSVEYWNENGERFSKYEFEFDYIDDSADADIVIEPDSYPLQCDHTISTDTIGCAPLLNADSTVDNQMVVRVVGDISQPAARETVKHELGHVLGLEHSSEPQSLMGHDLALTERQRSVINSVDTKALETDIVRAINSYREKHGLDGLGGNNPVLRRMARSRAKELARTDQSGAVVYTDDGMDLTCEIDLDGRSYLPEGAADLYSTSLYSFVGFGGLTNYSTAEYTGSPSDAVQQTVTEWQFNPSEPGYAEHYNRHGVGVYITDDGDFAAVRAIC